MIITTSILASPFVLLIWSLDAFLALASARLICGRLAAEWAGRASQGLAPLTDWAPDYLNRLLSGKTKSPLRSWVGWAIVIGAALALRRILVETLLSASHPVAP